MLNCDVINHTKETLLMGLHKTEDAIAPASRMMRDRKLMQFLADSAIKLNLILGIALVGSIAANIIFGWYALHQRQEYFASDNGRIVPLIPMSQPYRKNAV